MKTSSASEGSSRIIQFPARGRFAVARREENEATLQHASPRATKTVFSGAWYHEEAIRESERSRT